jgi:hypothetical protein
MAVLEYTMTISRVFSGVFAIRASMTWWQVVVEVAVVVVVVVVVAGSGGGGKQ